MYNCLVKRGIDLDQAEGYTEKDIISSLNEICDYIELESDWTYYKTDIEDSIFSILDELDYMREEYEGPPPAGGDGAREVFLNILQIIEKSAKELLLYIQDNGDSSSPASIRNQLLDAGSLTDSLRTAIAQTRLELAEILSKLKRGELKEGAPISDETHLYITDMDNGFSSGMFNSRA